MTKSDMIFEIYRLTGAKMLDFYFNTTSTDKICKKYKKAEIEQCYNDVIYSLNSDNHNA